MPASLLPAAGHKSLDEKTPPKGKRTQSGYERREEKSERQEGAHAVRKKMDGPWMVHFIAPSDIV